MDFGRDVICVDEERIKSAALHPGKIAIYEPGVDGLVATTPRSSAEVHHRSVQAVGDADAVLIVVGVAVARGDGHADLCYVYAAAEDSAQSLSGLTVVVTNSTVPVGIGDEVERIIRETNKANIVVAFNPEFQREGAAIRDFKFPAASSSAPPTSAAAR